MENLSIKLKLNGLVALLIAMMIGVGMFGMVSTHNIIAHLKADAHKEQELAHALELAERSEIEFQSQILAWKNMLLRAYDAEQFEKHQAEFYVQSDIVQEGLVKLAGKLQALDVDTSETRHVADMHRDMNRTYEAAMKQFNANDPAAGKALDTTIKDSDLPVTKAFDEMAHNISTEIDRVVKQSEAYATRVETSTRNTDIVMIVVGGLIGFTLGMLLIRGIIRSLNQIIHVTQRLAEGDMTTTIKASGKSEIGKLQCALAAMSDKLRSVVSQVRSSANTVSVSADEIAAGSLDLSTRTEEQAASIEETSSSLELITERVQQNSESAMRAVELATSATNKAENGLEVGQSAVNAINEIEASSEKVADIIGVIDEIAFQTNLLALNASIEAERAGEQGRGFSVVANEVQKLAQRSADAANEIKGLIKDSTGKVKEGTDLVTRCSQALEEIVESSNESNNLMQRISEASQEQAQGLAQVNAAVSQLEETTQQNAALVEETSAASNSMNDQAKGLTKLVSFFRFQNDGAGPAMTRDTAVDVVSESPNHVDQIRHSGIKDEDRPRRHTTETAGNLALKPASGSGDEWENF